MLLLIDNVFRFVQAGAEVSGLLGRMPSRVGYQPTLETEVAALQERIASVGRASVTAIEAVYVPADDFTDPAVTAISAHVDSTVVLSRQLAAEGIYPAIELGREEQLMVGRARKLQRFLTQPFFVAAAYTGMEGLSDRLLRGDLGAIPLQLLRLALLAAFLVLCSRGGAATLLAAAAGILGGRALILRRERVR